MKISYRKNNAIQDTVMNLTGGYLSTDELIQKVTCCLHDNQTIHTLSIENFDLYEKGADALLHAILHHKTLKNLSLINVRICSYPACSKDEDFFPQDLDRAVEHLEMILRDGKLENIMIKNLAFHDSTQRSFEHFDMVDPTVMRDILTQEKEPVYLKELLNSLTQNSHLRKLSLTTADLDVSKQVNLLRKHIRKLHRLAH